MFFNFNPTLDNFLGAVAGINYNISCEGLKSVEVGVEFEEKNSLACSIKYIGFENFELKPAYLVENGKHKLVSVSLCNKNSESAKNVGKRDQ